MELDIQINKPRSISFAYLNDNLSKQTLKLVPLDLKKIREERLINKTSTPRIDKRVRSDTLFKINSIEEELKQYKSVGKTKIEENKLIFNRDSRPKSALRGSEDTIELIKIAETTANLFTQKKALAVVNEIPSKKIMKTSANQTTKSSNALKVISHAGLMNLIKGTNKTLKNTKNKPKIPKSK